MGLYRMSCWELVNIRDIPEIAEEIEISLSTVWFKTEFLMEILIWPVENLHHTKQLSEMVKQISILNFFF